MTYIVKIIYPNGIDEYLQLQAVDDIDRATRIIHSDHANALAHCARSLVPTIQTEIIELEEHDNEHPSISSRPANISD